MSSHFTLRPLVQSAAGLFCLLLLWVMSLPVRAYDREQAIRWLHQVKHHIDSADIKGTDPDYLELSEYGFVAYARASLTGTHLAIDYELPQQVDGAPSITGRLNSLMTHIFTLGVAYRGWGVSYSTDLSGNEDSEWAFSSYGQKYGFEARLHQNNTLSGDLKRDNQLDADRPVLSIDVHDIHQKIVLANFYWVFSHNRFSLPAAMSHTVLQHRSAGSFLAILNLHHVGSHVNDPNLSIAISPVFAPEGTSIRSQFRKLTQTQLSLGGGYAYNYVFPNQRLLMHGSFMPMLSVWHSNRTYWDVMMHNVQDNQTGIFTYDSSFSQRPITFNASLHYNLVYNHGRYVTGLLSMINIDSLPGRGRLTLYTFDWCARFLFGVRF